jgi:hypothetical protein
MKGREQQALHIECPCVEDIPGLRKYYFKRLKPSEIDMYIALR